MPLGGLCVTPEAEFSSEISQFFEPKFLFIAVTEPFQAAGSKRKLETKTLCELVLHFNSFLYAPFTSFSGSRHLVLGCATAFEGQIVLQPTLLPITTATTAGRLFGSPSDPQYRPKQAPSPPPCLPRTSVLSAFRTKSPCYIAQFFVIFSVLMGLKRAKELFLIFLDFGLPPPAPGTDRLEPSSVIQLVGRALKHIPRSRRVIVFRPGSQGHSQPESPRQHNIVE